MKIRGIIPPVAIPMLPNEDLDLPRLRWFLDHLINSGVHGVFVLGTNSEFFAMDEREKQQVIATAVEHLRGIDARSRAAHEDGGKRSRARRLSDYAVFHHAVAAGDLRPLSPDRGEH